MAPPAALVRTARCLWQWQWQQLMGGLAPADASGNYRRPKGVFTALPPLPDDAKRSGGHALIVGRSCPWAHRAWLVWCLRELGETISLVVVEPDPEAGRWRFNEPFQGCSTLAELYQRSGAPPGTRATVPALVSLANGQILLSESAQLIELLNQWPSSSALNLDPAAQREQDQQWRERLQHNVNDGVYRCGFARNQAAYDRAEQAFFATLEQANQSLAAAPGDWLGGPELGLADVVLFPTLMRLELVYAPLFGCSRLPLWQFPELWQWRSRFYALPGVAASCDGQAWRRDYFGALFPLHPSGIVPAGPPLATLVTTHPRS